ncbi:MAG TPA: extracellular solute-binding protein [Candidatus Mediterraneibacter cottocaccae]|nr:extracellular solute-binding protein [Candidatus Mediterraneibacter cottocaccae]
MKKYKKVLAAAMALTMGLGMAGCGSSSDEPKEDADKQTNEGTEGGDDLSGTLVYWSMWNDTEPQGMVWQQIIDGFMEEHPNVKVEVQWCGRDNKKVLKPALDGGETIDIFEYPLEIDLNDYVLDLTDYVDKAYQATDGKKLSEIVLPSLLETPKTMTGLDIQPAVGYKPWMSLFMYNKAIFDEAGITEEPKTWEELDAACAKVKEAGYVPITFDDAYASWLPGMYLAREKGQEWVQQLVNDKTGEMWKDEAVVNMAKAYEDFANKGYFDANVGGNKYPAGQQDIGSGKVAMYYNLTGLTTEVSSVTGPDFKWGGFSFPDVADGQNKCGVEDPAGCTMLAVNKNTADPELAMEFIAYALSPEMDQKMVDEAGTTPATVDTAWPASLESMKGVFESNQVALNSGADITSNPDIAPTIQENFIKLASGQITADEFVNNMAAAAAQ